MFVTKLCRLNVLQQRALFTLRILYITGHTQKSSSRNGYSTMDG